MLILFTATLPAAKFSVNRGWLKEATDDEVDKVACHEMLHYILSPVLWVADEAINLQKGKTRQAYFDWMTTVNEQVVTDLTAIIRDKK